jgi:3-hydroxyacyl-CoA dehydrogenase
MITARSPVVGLPRGKYKLADVLRHVMKKNRKGYKKGTGKYGNPRKRLRPFQPVGGHQVPKSKRVDLRLAEEWKRKMEEEDPNGLLELWNK